MSNDDFIRTTEKRHYTSVIDIWSRLEKSKDIYLSKYKGWYSVSDEAYYDEEEIETKNNIKCAKISGSKVEWVEEEYQHGRINYLNYMRIIKNLSYLNQEKMRLCNL